MNKKWTLIQPLRAQWPIPNPNHPWDNNVFYTISKLLKANAFHIESSDIEMTSDIYFLVSFDIALIEKEILFVKKLHDFGKKVVVAFSQDFRFMVGDGLVDEKTGYMYTDLVKEADLTISGVSEKLHIYGRYQNKVISAGPFIENLNFSLPYHLREIDVLLSGPSGEQGFGLNLEIMLAIKEKFPNAKVAYSLRDGFNRRAQIMHQKGILVFTPPIINLLPNTKVYIDSQIRPRPGRVLDEAWYCRTPFISHDLTYLSRIFPEYSYSEMSIDKIVSLYSNLIQEDYDTLMQRAGKLIEEDYYENVINKIENKLYGV